MKILLISDIHGNYPALAAISEAVAKHNISYVLNCGDSLVYAPFPNQTLDWLRSRDAFSIRGNTDDRVIKLLKGKTFKKPANPEKRIMYTSTMDALSKENAAYLLKLKKKKLLRLGHNFIGLYHGSPAEHEEFLFADTPDKRFLELAQTTSCEIIVTGHSHSPYHKHIGGVHFINPGSVGRMFDGTPEASYALLKIKKGNVEVKHHRCPYDIETVVEELKKNQFPPVYGEMYRLGKKLN